jgi:hypothetical protein
VSCFVSSLCSVFFKSILICLFLLISWVRIYLLATHFTCRSLSVYGRARGMAASVISTPASAASIRGAGGAAAGAGASTGATLYTSPSQAVPAMNSRYSDAAAASPISPPDLPRGANNSAGGGTTASPAYYYKPQLPELPSEPSSPSASELGLQSVSLCIHPLLLRISIKLEVIRLLPLQMRVVVVPHILVNARSRIIRRMHRLI